MSKLSRYLSETVLQKSAATITTSAALTPVTRDNSCDDARRSGRVVDEEKSENEMAVSTEPVSTDEKPLATMEVSEEVEEGEHIDESSSFDAVNEEQIKEQILNHSKSDNNLETSFTNGYVYFALIKSFITKGSNY